MRKKVFLGVVAVGIVVGSLLASAQWLGTGSGSGRSRATVAVAATVDPVDCADEPECIDLYPGFTGGDLYFTITNTNPYAITFTEMTPGAVTVDAGHPDCPADAITVASASDLELVAPAGSTTDELSIADVVTMVETAPDGCQGASFDIELTLSGAQS